MKRTGKMTNWSDFARRVEKGARNAPMMSDEEIGRFAANLGRFMRSAGGRRPDGAGGRKEGR
jgi:hypothetical protein